MRHIVAAVATLVFALFGSPAQAADAARGETLYQTTYNCSRCHGPIPTVDDPVGGGITATAIANAIAKVPEMHSLFATTLGQNPIDMADIAAYIAQSIGLVVTPDLDQHGLTGSWYEPVTSGQGVEIEFYPNLAGVETAYVQGAWFTFDVAPAGGAERNRWYTFSGNGKSGAASVPVTIYQNVGGNFDAGPVTSAVAVGTGSLAFTDCTTGTFDYTFSDGSGRSGTVVLTRIMPNVTCAVSGTPPTNADFALSGNWYDSATSGQGFVFEVNPTVPYFFLTWYTYAPTGQVAGAAGQRWFTGQGAWVPGSRAVTVPLYETTGGVFDQPSNPAPATNPVGTVTVTFATCASASVQFNFTAGSSAGKSGLIAVTRVGPVPPGCAI